MEKIVEGKKSIDVILHLGLTLLSEIRRRRCSLFLSTHPVVCEGLYSRFAYPATAPLRFHARQTAIHLFPVFITAIE
jgi:hypothetical protein